jgi:hypothetical protein
MGHGEHSSNFVHAFMKRFREDDLAMASLVLLYICIKDGRGSEKKEVS